MTDLINLARLIRAQLSHRRADLSPCGELSATLGVTEPAIVAAAHRFADLGLCGPPEQPHVWWLPTPPLLAGFEPVHVRGHLVLRLVASVEADPPLHLAAHHVATPVREQPLTPQLTSLSMGPLGTMVTRLCLLMPNTCEMFELIAHTWRTGGVVFSTGPLQVHQTQQQPDELELVTWHDDHGDVQMINLYPSGMHNLVFDTEEC